MLPLQYSGTYSGQMLEATWLPSPPGYKFKSKNLQTKVHVNRTNSTASEESSSFDSVLSALTSTQCQQLITLLSSQLHGSADASPESQQLNPSVAYFLSLLLHSLPLRFYQILGYLIQVQHIMFVVHRIVLSLLIP